MLLVMLLFYFPFYYVRMDVECGCVRSVCVRVCARFECFLNYYIFVTIIIFQYFLFVLF